MSACMVGYMVRGPVSLDPGLFPGALADLKVRQDAVNALYLSLLSVQMDGDNPDMDEERAESLLVEALERHFPDLYLVSDHLDVEDIALMSIQADGEALLVDLENLWGGRGTSDCMWRDFDEGYRVMFCGARTWGDDPDGYGYATLKRLDHAGLLAPVGIT